MQFIPVKTRAFLPPKDDVYKLFEESLPRLKDGDVLFISSKVLGIHEGRCVKIGPGVDKEALIRREAEAYIPRNKVPKALITPTIKGGAILAFAGIDESNGNGYYVFWPKDPSGLARQICERLKKKFRIRRLAVIATDSYVRPLRAGVIGISVGFYGLEPLYDYRGKKDIFGRKLKVTQTNIVDSMTAMATLLMGEGSERRPFLILRGADFVRFTSKPTYRKALVSPKIDLYRPMLKVFKRSHG